MQEPRYNGMAVKATKPMDNKSCGWNAQTAQLESGFVYFLKAATWLAEYVSELTTFLFEASSLFRAIQK